MHHAWPGSCGYSVSRRCAERHKLQHRGHCTHPHTLAGLGRRSRSGTLACATRQHKPKQQEQHHVPIHR
eukprot:11480744-Alexandrium_andersonii.AAC.1